MVCILRMGTSLFWGTMKLKGKPTTPKKTNQSTNQSPPKVKQTKTNPLLPRIKRSHAQLSEYNSSYHSHLMWEYIHYISPLKTAQSRSFWVSTSANSCLHTSYAYTTSKSKAGSLQARLGIKLQYCPQCCLPKYTVDRQALSGQTALGCNTVRGEKEWILSWLWRGQKDSHTRRGFTSLILTCDFSLKLRKPQVLWSMFSTNSCTQPAHKWKI